MYHLYHHTLCPFSRKVRIHLAAKDVDFELIQENFWERRKEFITMNPAGTVPVLFDIGSSVAICGSDVIVEYIEEKYSETKNLLGDSIVKRAEVRRLQNWFDEKFYGEVTKHVLAERYFNRFLPGSRAPSSDVLRITRNNLSVHLNYIEHLLEARKYLGGEYATIADFSAASQISVLDYFGDVNWSHHASVKDWYSLVKSHKMFGELLKDRLPGVNPVQWYSKLDF